MKEDVFRVGYTTYLQKPKRKRRNWTSKLRKKMIEHKVIVAICMTILICIIMNFWLIYKFMSILELSKIF